jgi:hypothetical protein
MRLPQRLIAATVLVALSGALAGCSGGGLGDLDPSSMLDFLDTKKKLPGERRPVFPEGVPGVEQGVPRDLYKGAQEQQLQQQVPPVAEAPPPEPKPQRSRATRHPSAKRAAPAEPAARQADESAAIETKPAPAPKRKRTRITAPEQEQPAPAPQQQSQQQPPPQQQKLPPPQQQELKPFPAPLPSGSFQR